MQAYKRRRALRRVVTFAATSALAVTALSALTPPSSAVAAGSWDEQWTFPSQFSGKTVTYPVPISADTVLASLNLPSDAVAVRATVPSYTSTNAAPQIFYVYANAGDEIAAHFGGRAFSVPSLGEATVLPTTFNASFSDARKWDYGKHFAYWTMVAPSGAVIETNDNALNVAAPGFNSGPNRYERPNGAWYVPETGEGAHQPSAYVAPESGVYAFAVRNSAVGTDRTAGFPWQITVRDSAGVEQQGRTWTEDLGLVDGFTFRGLDTVGVDVDLKVLSEVGYQYDYGLHGITNYNTRVQPSSFGIAGTDCVTQYGSRPVASVVTPECDTGRYRIFFETPAADMPETATAPRLSADRTAWQPLEDDWVLPALQEPEIELGAFVPNDPAGSSYDGTFTVTWDNFIGAANILLDADGDGAFDGPLDRSFPFVASTASGSTIFAFDGLDAAGDPIVAGTFARAQVTVARTAEIHVTVDDPEQIKDGIVLHRLNGTGIEEDRVYWDDSAINNALTCSTGYPGSDPADAANPLSTTDGSGVQVGLPASTENVHRWTSPRTLSLNCPDSSSAQPNRSWGESNRVDHWSYAQSDSTSEIVFLRDAPSYALGDLVWVDIDGDGAQGSDEPGVAGVQVRVLDSSDTVIGTATTDTDGVYVVDSLVAGSYRVEFTLAGTAAAKYAFVGAAAPGTTWTTGPIALDASNPNLTPTWEHGQIQATVGIDPTADAPVQKIANHFTARKVVDGTASTSAPDNARYVIDYSWPAGEDYPAGSGTLELVAGEAAVQSAEVPLDATVTVSERTPAAVPGATWGEPKFSEQGFEISSSQLELIVTNTLTLDASGGAGGGTGGPLSNTGGPDSAPIAAIAIGALVLGVSLPLIRRARRSVQ